MPACEVTEHLTVTDAWRFAGLTGASLGLRRARTQTGVDGVAQVNLLLNRASPWLDVDSCLPYEGKVVIRNKTAKRLYVRIPLWVNKREVQCHVKGRGGKEGRLFHS